MQDRDYEVHGLEISQEIAETARKRFDLDDVRCCHIKDAGFEAGSFDLVVLWDVIEHMADPITELRLCRDLLAAGGALIVQTQDVSSLARKLMGRRWHHFKQLEHIYHFDPSTIAELLDRSGLRIEKITRRRAGKYVSFEFIRERLKRFGRIADLMGRPLKLLGRRFLYVNPFDEMIVVARLKPPREDAQA
jgi:SAM-dependent methyltransferase